ncbi:nickel-dependent hydrogenase large subunit [Thiohalorhabdus sp.]|uniref:nickel-dependent hydrogenase large subunit n=1 Tax=Thiohalorhabdus sp. TaxID=3094134 RepID=UPI002FC31B91
MEQTGSADPAAGGPAAEGGLGIRIRLAGTTVAGVEIASRRPVGASRVFQGKDPDGIPGMVRRLFAVCGHAQGVASLSALEAARGQDPGPRVLAAREAVLQAELAREHLTRILVDWSGWLRDAVPRGVAARVRQLPEAVTRAAYPEGIFFQATPPPPAVLDLADEIADLEGMLRKEVLGIEPAAFGEMDLPDALGAYMEGTGALGPAFLGRLAEEGWASTGAGGSVPFLPDLAPEELAPWLGGEEAGDFVARPLWEGRPRETGPLARTWGCPPVAAARAGFGSGVLVRQVARLAELAMVPARLRELAEGQGPATIGAGSPAPGVGVGTVEAARGRLVHRLALENCAVTDYRILAPTEWNFHPDGALVQGLVGTDPGGVEAARRAADHLIGSIDPCVGYRLEVDHA